MSKGSASQTLSVGVALTCGIDIDQWRQRNAADEVPGRTPYGLHLMERTGNDGVRVTLTSAPSVGARQRRVRNAVRHRLDGLEMLDVAAVRRELAGADAVLAYDERTGVPAQVLLPRTPVVTGAAWLGDRTSQGRWSKPLIDRGLPRAAGVFTQCEPMVDELAHQWRIPRGRLHYVPLGIDCDFYAEQTWPDEPGLVVSAGEDRFRDHQLLIDAVADAGRRDRSIRLELATGLPVAMPPEWTLHTGRLDGRMRDLYARASVVAVALMPTLTGSGLTVILEAFASGRPVVVTANPGISEYVSHGETGILVPPGDRQAFADAVYSLASDPERCREMGARAAAHVRTHFTNERMADRLLDVVRSAAGH